MGQSRRPTSHGDGAPSVASARRSMNGSGIQRSLTGGLARGKSGDLEQQPSRWAAGWKRMQRQAMVAIGGIRHEPHILLVPLMVAAMCMMLGLSGVVKAAHDDTHKARSTAQSHVDAAANALSISFMSSLLPLVQLASTIRYTQDYNQLMDMWHVRAPDWWSSVPKGVQTLRMTPFGIIAAVYPLNPDTQYLIGVDVLEGARRADSLQVIAYRNATSSGPLYLDGVYSLLVRIPVFIANVSRDEQFNIPWNGSHCPPELCYIEETRSKWWGYAVMGMDWHEFLESHGSPLQPLQSAASSGLHYQLDRPPNEVGTPPETGWQVVQSSGGGERVAHAVAAQVNVLGRQWQLYAWVDDWTPSYKVPLMVVVVVGSLICAGLLFMVLLTRAEHDALLRSLLPEAAINRALEDWRWSNEQDTGALDMLLQGTPAEAMMSIVGDLVLGKVPPLSEVVAVRSALEAGANIYQPLRQDLSDRMSGQMDSEVKAALMAQLLGQSIVRTAAEQRQEEEDEAAGAGAGEEGAAWQQEDGVRPKTRPGSACDIRSVYSRRGSGQLEHTPSSLLDHADCLLPSRDTTPTPTLLGRSSLRQSGHHYVRLQSTGHLLMESGKYSVVEDDDPYASIEGALVAITGICAGMNDGSGAIYGRATPNYRITAPIDVVRPHSIDIVRPTVAPTRAPVHQRATAHACVASAEERHSSDGQVKLTWREVPPLQGLNNARTSLTALLRLNLSKRTRHTVQLPTVLSPHEGEDDGGGDAHSGICTPERVEFHATLGEPRGAAGKLPKALSCGMEGALKETKMIEDPGRPLYTQLEAILQGTSQWTFNAFALEDAACGRPLSALGFWLFHQSGLIDQCHLHRGKLARFLMKIEDGYHDDNPYHNRRHAADVLRTLHILLTRGGLVPGYADNYTLVACYLAAIVHDYDHLGFNNDFLVVCQHELAVRYNDRSPMENHHLAAAWSLLRKSELNFLDKISKSRWKCLRKLVVDLVLSTDMKCHFAVMGQFSALHKLAGSSDLDSLASTSQASSMSGAVVNRSGATSGAGDTPAETASRTAAAFRSMSSRRLTSLVLDGNKLPGGGKGLPPVVSTPVSESDQLLSLQVAMKVADLGHMAASLHVHRKWVRGLEQEFFLQGDREHALGLPCSPLCDRTKQGVTKSQIGFFDYVVIPLFTNYVHRFSAARPLHRAMMRNYRHWQAEAKGMNEPGKPGRMSSNGG